jgi:hypothetical protein
MRLPPWLAMPQSQWAALSHPLALLGFSAVIGIVYVLYLFPIGFLAGYGGFWQAPPIEDIATGIAGLRYYVSDEWRFPLFRTVKIAPPEGISITYLDTLPLLAMCARLLKRAFAIEWNYFGLWIAVCYVLQSVSTVVLLRSVGVRGALPTITGAALALFSPAFLFRLYHPTLCGHFLIILALALYFIAVRSSSFDQVWPWFCGLAWVSLWVQAYLFVMVTTLFLWTTAQTAVARRGGWLQSSTALGSFAVVSFLLMWISGFFWERSDLSLLAIGSPQGFGRTSMNVLSPIIPQWSSLFPGVAAHFGADNGLYKAVGIIDATGGQYEGYNYLGAGSLLLIVIAIFLEGRCLMSKAKKYWGLIGALLFLTALAITHRIYIGKWAIELTTRVPLVFEDIRSSGRLFWPVGYMLTISAVAIVALRSRRLLGLGLLLSALVLQIGDTTSIRYWIRHWVTQGYSAGARLPAQPWVDIIRQHDELKIFPSAACANQPRVWNFIADLVFHASESGTPVNTAAVDRPKSIDCRTEETSIGHLELAQETLVVLLDSHYASLLAASDAGYRQFCRSFDKGLACSHQWDQLDRMGWTGIFTRL